MSELLYNFRDIRNHNFFILEISDLNLYLSNTIKMSSEFIQDVKAESNVCDLKECVEEKVEFYTKIDIQYLYEIFPTINETNIIDSPLLIKHKILSILHKS